MSVFSSCVGPYLIKKVMASLLTLSHEWQTSINLRVWLAASVRRMRRQSRYQPSSFGYNQITGSHGDVTSPLRLDLSVRGFAK